MCVVVATVLNVQAVYRARGVVSDLFEAVPSCALTVIDNANQPPAPGKHGFMWKEGAVWVPASSGAVWAAGPKQAMPKLAQAHVRMHWSE